MQGVVIHVAFDVLAWLVAGACALWLARGARICFPASIREPPYLAALLVGAGVGAYLFGTANLFLSGAPGIGRSIEGAVAGGILAVELYKRGAGIRARTGARFAAAARRRHRRRPHRLLSRGPGRFHLRHTDLAALGT